MVESPQQALEAVLVLTAIPIVLTALWAEYFTRYIDSVRKNLAQIRRAMEFDIENEVVRVRLAGGSALLFHLLLYLGTLDVRHIYPAVCDSLFVMALVVQLYFQVKMVRDVRMLENKTSPGPETARAGGAGLALLWAFAGMFLYLGAMLFCIFAAVVIGKVTGMPPVARSILLGVAGIIGVISGVGLNFALAPKYMKNAVPSRSMEDEPLYPVLLKEFANAGLRAPSMFVIEDTARSTVAQPIALIAGFARGKGWFTPALFLSRSLIKTLSESELRAVVAHEIAHIRLNHLRRRLALTTFLIFGLTVAAALLAVTFNWIFQKAELAQLIGPSVALFSFVAAMRVLSRQSRRHEVEADLYAVLRLGSTREDLISALRKMDPSEARPRMLLGSSHPATSERIRLLQAYFASRDVEKRDDSDQAA